MNRIIIAVFGLLILAVGTANAASSCERVWGYKDPAVLQAKFDAVVTRTAIPNKPHQLDAVRLGQLLVGYVAHNCMERFAALPDSVKTPQGFLQYVGILSKRKPASKVYTALLYRHMQRGVALHLPSPGEVAKRIKRQTAALTADLKAGHVSPNLPIRLQELREAAKKNKELEKAVRILEVGFAKLRRGELPSAVANNLSQLVEQKLQTGLVELKAKLAEHGRQLQKQGKTLERHGQRLAKLETGLATERSRNNVQDERFNDLKDAVDKQKEQLLKQQYSLFGLGLFFLLALLAVLWKVDRDQKKHKKFLADSNQALKEEQEFLHRLVRDLSEAEALRRVA